MRTTVVICTAFLGALISTILLMISSTYSFMIDALFNKELLIILLIISSVIFNKRIVKTIRKINVFSWVIIVSSLIGTLSMEFATYQSGVPFQGLLIILPLAMSFIFWSQKREDILCVKHSEWSQSNSFKTDLFWVSTSFFLAAVLSILLDLNNSDLRGWWPYVIYFKAFFGIFFSWGYALLGMAIKRNHIKYTSLISLGIILSNTLLKYLPSSISLFQELKIESFYFISALIFLIHLGVCFMSYMSRRT